MGNVCELYDRKSNLLYTAKTTEEIESYTSRDANVDAICYVVRDINTLTEFIADANSFADRGYTVIINSKRS